MQGLQQLHSLLIIILSHSEVDDSYRVVREARGDLVPVPIPANLKNAATPVVSSYQRAIFNRPNM